MLTSLLASNSATYRDHHRGNQDCPVEVRKLKIATYELYLSYGIQRTTYGRFKNTNYKNYLARSFEVRTLNPLFRFSRELSSDRHVNHIAKLFDKLRNRDP